MKRTILTAALAACALSATAQIMEERNPVPMTPGGGRVYRTEVVPYDARHDAEARNREAGGYWKAFEPEVTIATEGPLHAVLEQEIEIPFAWTDGMVYLHVENPGSAYSLWLNDRQVAEVSDPLTPAEFDLTPYIREGVNDFKVGDRVAGEAHVGCGKCDNCKKGHYTVCLNYGKDGHDGGLDMGHRHYGFYWQGANAEYNVYKTSALHIIPDNVSYDVAAMTDCAGVAFHGVEMAGVTPGGTCVVIGPGPIGLCAMQECKALGAARVIVVGRGAKLEKARELGADVCIDFEKEDPVQRVLELTNGIGADEVMECSGAADSPMKACKMARKTGKVALIATYHAGDVMIPANTVNFNELTIVGSKANPNVSEQVLHFFSTGAIQGDKLVTHTFPLEDYEKAVDIFEHKKDGSIKVVINP